MLKQDYKCGFRWGLQPQGGCSRSCGGGTQVLKRQTSQNQKYSDWLSIWFQVRISYMQRETSQECETALTWQYETLFLLWSTYQPTDSQLYLLGKVLEMLLHLGIREKQARACNSFKGLFPKENGGKSETSNVPLRQGPVMLWYRFFFLTGTPLKT